MAPLSTTMGTVYDLVVVVVASSVVFILVAAGRLRHARRETGFRSRLIMISVACLLLLLLLVASLLAIGE